MFTQNNLSGMILVLFTALAMLPRFQPGFAENEDQDSEQLRKALRESLEQHRQEFKKVRLAAVKGDATI